MACGRGPGRAVWAIGEELGAGADRARRHGSGGEGGKGASHHSAQLGLGRAYLGRVPGGDGGAEALGVLDLGGGADGHFEAALRAVPQEARHQPHQPPLLPRTLPTPAPPHRGRRPLRAGGGGAGTGGDIGGDGGGDLGGLAGGAGGALDDGAGVCDAGGAGAGGGDVGGDVPEQADDVGAALLAVVLRDRPRT